MKKCVDFFKQDMVWTQRVVVVWLDTVVFFTWCLNHHVNTDCIIKDLVDAVKWYMFSNTCRIMKGL